MTLTLISTGLADHNDMSLKAQQAAQQCHKLYAEQYTTILNTTLQQLEQTTQHKITPLPRSAYEETSQQILQEAKTHDIGILIGGDSLTATTHISLILDATKQGIPTRIIHGSSILTAIAETGLSLYKFGRTVTLPLPDKAPPDTVLQTLIDNREQGLHTLILLDLDTQNPLTADKAIQTLLDADKPEAYNKTTITVALTRLGWPDSTITADTAENLTQHHYGPPPHTLIVPGKLHFHEEEALQTLAGLPPKALETHNPTGEVQRLTTKYLKSCRQAIQNLKKTTPPDQLTTDNINSLIQHATNYLDDSEYYAQEKKATALASVSYAEGILDALRLLGLVDFQW